MAPKRKVLRKPKAAPKSAEHNARGRCRRDAVAAMNVLAEEVGVATVRRKAPAGKVEAFVRLLEKSCQAPALFARLRSAVEMYVANGGSLSVPLLPAPDSTTSASQEECDDIDALAPPPVTRHRLLDEGFSLNPKHSCSHSTARLSP